MTQKTDPMQTPEAASLLRNPQRLRELLKAPETRQLMELLRRQNGSQLHAAAEQARQGDSSALSGMLREMTRSQAGAEAMEQLQSKLEK